MKRQDFIQNLKETLGERYKVTIVAPDKKALKCDYTHYNMMVTSVNFNEIIYVGYIVCEKDNSIFYIENIAIRSSYSTNDIVATILKLTAEASN